MITRDIKNYSIYRGFKITYNPKERTYTIYTRNNQFLGTVNDGELNSEIDLLEEEGFGAD